MSSEKTTYLKSETIYIYRGKLASSLFWSGRGVKPKALRVGLGSWAKWLFFHGCFFRFSAKPLLFWYLNFWGSAFICSEYYLTACLLENIAHDNTKEKFHEVLFMPYNVNWMANTPRRIMQLQVHFTSFAVLMSPLNFFLVQLSLWPPSHEKENK